MSMIKDVPVCFYKSGIEWIIGSSRFTSLKVLILLLQKADSKGRIEVAQCTRDWIKSELGIDKTTLSRAFRDLIEDGVLVRGINLNLKTGEMKEDRSVYIANIDMIMTSNVNSNGERDCF